MPLNGLIYFPSVNTTGTDIHSLAGTLYQYPYLLDIGEPSSFRLVMGMTYTIPKLRTLAADITSPGH